MTRNVLVVADAPGFILERLSRAWIRNGSAGSEQNLVCATDRHPFQMRRLGEAAGAIFWVDSLSFVRFPRAARVPQILMVHHITDPEMPLFTAALPSADAVATSSVRWQENLATMGVRATLVPYVIDTRIYQPADRLAARRALGLENADFVIGFSARAQANAFGRKGIDLFLEIVHAAGSRWPRTAVLLIGSGWESVARSIEERGVQVVWSRPERTEDTAALYPAMDVFLCTSKEEGGPCTILEAMACDVPVITTDVGHVPEVVSDGETGFVVRERAAERFVERIAELRADVARAERIGRAGREFVRAHRDERVVSPRIPFGAMYDEARQRYARRSAAEYARRTASLGYLAARYVASIVARRRSA